MKSPGDLEKYQIDFISVNQRFVYSVTNAKTLLEVNVDTDHNLSVADLQTRSKHIEYKWYLNKKWHFEKLKRKNYGFI